MADGTAKKKNWEAVRIWSDPKEQLLDLVLEKTRRNKKRVTEVSEASRAVTEYVKREKRKLGIA